MGFNWTYPLVKQFAIHNGHFDWENALFLLPFSIAMQNYQRVKIKMPIRPIGTG